jgi:hypothetical protein
VLLAHPASDFLVLKRFGDLASMWGDCRSEVDEGKDGEEEGEEGKHGSGGGL